MDYLIDTHALIWFIEGDIKISEKAKSILENNALTIGISIASFWEIAIKISLGKLKLKKSLPEIIKQTENLEINILPIKPEYIFGIQNMKFHHKDPFDRIIISTAITENSKIISLDENFDNYSEINRVW